MKYKMDHINKSVNVMIDVKPYRFKMLSYIDILLSKGILGTTNLLRGFNYTSILLVDKYTGKYVKGCNRLKVYNKNRLPAKITNPYIRSFIHRNVIFLRDVSILLNKTFDGIVTIPIFIIRGLGKIIGKSLIWLLESIEKRLQYSYLPKTSQSFKYFIITTTDESLLIVEALDDSLTRIFGSTTSLILDIMNHVFGEDIKDISSDIMILSNETFKFYKNVKLLKFRLLIRSGTKEGLIESMKTISKIIKDDKQ
jgi:hypothetical protein